MKPEIYAEELRKSLGLDAALKVALNCMERSNPKNWKDLPKSAVFLATNKRGEASLNERSLRKTFNYWSTVASVLKKRSEKRV